MPGPRCLQQRCTCSGTNEAQKPVPYRRLADSVGASRTSGNASYGLCAQIKDERSVRWCNRLEWNHLASFVEDPSIECGQPRHACCDEAAQRLLESRKGHSTGGVRPWLRTSGSRVSHDGRADCDIGVRTEQSERSRRQVLAVGCNRDKFAGRASARISTGQCSYPGAIVIQLARLMPTDGDTQRGCTKFFPS